MAINFKQHSKSSYTMGSILQQVSQNLAVSFTDYHWRVWQGRSSAWQLWIL